MKNKILHLGAFLIFNVGITLLFGQNIERQTASGKTYIIDKSRQSIRNKSNILEFDNIDEYCGRYSVIGDIVPQKIDSIVKSIFSEKKLKLLAQQNMTMMLSFICDRSGKIISIEFKSHKIDRLASGTLISLDELNQIEKKILPINVPLDISPDCINKYFRLSKAIVFKRYIQ